MNQRRIKRQKKTGASQTVKSANHRLDRFFAQKTLPVKNRVNGSVRVGCK